MKLYRRHRENRALSLSLGRRWLAAFLLVLAAAHLHAGNIPGGQFQITNPNWTLSSTDTSKSATYTISIEKLLRPSRSGYDLGRLPVAWLVASKQNFSVLDSNANSFSFITLAECPASQQLYYGQYFTNFYRSGSTFNRTDNAHFSGTYYVGVIVTDEFNTASCYGQVRTITFTNGPPKTYTLSTSASGGTIARSPSQSSYVDGTVVTLTATPSSGYVFSGWSGSVTGTSNPVTLTMNANKSVTALFTRLYTLTVNASHGSVSKSPSQSTYKSGTSVKLTATPASGYVFTGWSGSASGTTNPLTITMNGDKTITANFAPSYSLSVSASHGSIVKSPNQSTFVSGAKVTLTATADSGYIFTGWSGALSGTANPATLTMDGNKSVTANFARAYEIYLLDNTSGTVVRSAPGPYAVGTVVTLTAVPKSGYVFNRWSVAGGYSTDNPIFVTMDSDKSMSVSFSRLYTLTVAASHGTVLRSPNLTSYPSGTNVTLTATPASGYVFTGWTGSVTSSENPVTIAMDGAKSVTANFTAIHTLGVSAENGTVTKTPNQITYLDGAVVTLTATPATNYAFTGWTGTLTSQANPLALTMRKSHVLTAHFSRTYQLQVDPSVGTVVRKPQGDCVLENTKVTLTAVAPKGYRFTGWTGTYTGTLNPMVITMDRDWSLRANFVVEDDPRVVAVFEKDILVTPSPGWAYWLNAMGPVGKSENYQQLARTASAWDIFDGNGVAGLPDAAPFGNGYLGTIDPSGAFGDLAGAPGGHPGPGLDAGAVEHYVLASYTFGATGYYSIVGSAIESAESGGNGLNLRIYLNDRLLASKSTPPGAGATATFDMSLGRVAANTRLFVAVGPGDSDAGDAFALAYTIRRDSDPPPPTGVASPTGAASPVRKRLTVTKPTAKISGHASGSVVAVRLTDLRTKRTVTVRVHGGKWKAKLRKLSNGTTVITVVGVLSNGSLTAPTRIRIKRKQE
jgi:uncharacterized repeat protein (TIGR02543 family)